MNIIERVSNRGHPHADLEEMFVDIAGYEGEYQISNHGNVRSLKKVPFLILKPMVATNGYLTACLWKNGRQRKIGIHRLVASAFIDNPENFDEVNHKDEDKTNNRVDNLEWCSHQYNMNYGMVREKISKANIGKPSWCKGKKRPQLTAAQLGKAHPHKGHTNSMETRAKISAAKTGTTLSEERKRQISLDTSKRRWLNDGVCDKFVYSDEMTAFLNAGWRTGRLSHQ